jgi:SAM-dependent methyltransferase
MNERHGRRLLEPWMTAARETGEPGLTGRERAGRCLLGRQASGVAARSGSRHRREHRAMDPTTRANVHLQSGHGLDDVALVRAGARSVVGIDYSQVAVTAAQRRADQLGAACRYVAATVPRVPLASASADLVYTGKGALIWLPDLAAWARDAARLLRPGGHLFVYEAHPAVALWTWDEDRPRIREDRGYFARSHVNDTFPARGAVEWQWSLGQVVTAVAAVT